MIGATILRPADAAAEGCGQWASESEQVPTWDQEASPRLHETDLADPESFHRRLVDWIMNQK
jgi:hypothetical protein